MSITSNATSGTRTIAMTGSGVDFSLAQATPGTVQITAGTPATVTLNLAQNGPLVNDVNFTCAFPTQLTGASCSLNPPKIMAGIPSGSTTLTINTTAGGALPPLAQKPDPRLFYPLWLGAVALALLRLASRHRQLLQPRLAFYLPLALLLLAVAFIAGCGGGGGMAGTPKGPSTVTVTSTSGAVSKTTLININVN